jgi:PTS system fructose-specific IIC component
MAFHVGLRAPHGGIFVFFAVIHLGLFLVALVAGMLVACAGVVALKTAEARKTNMEEVSALA